MATAKKGAKQKAPANDDDAGETKGGGKGHNSKKFDGELLKEALEDIAALELKMQKRVEAANKQNEPDRQKIKQIKDDLVDSGIPARELGVLLRKVKLERKLANVDDQLDDEGKEVFANLVEALGPFKDTPLGQAAVKRGESR